MLDVGLDHRWVYLYWCCWHVCSWSRVSGDDLGQGMLQKTSVACGLWECGQTVPVKTCFLLMILASDQGGEQPFSVVPVVKPQLDFSKTNPVLSNHECVEALQCLRPGL